MFQRSYLFYEQNDIKHIFKHDALKSKKKQKKVSTCVWIVFEFSLF